MTKTPGERIVGLEKDVEAIFEDIRDLKTELKDVKAITVANEKTLRWATGAAAAFGAVGAMVLPKLTKLLGLG